MMSTIQSWMPVVSLVVSAVVAILHKLHKDAVADRIAAVEAKMESAVQK